MGSVITPRLKNKAKQNKGNLTQGVRGIQGVKRWLLVLLHGSTLRTGSSPGTLYLRSPPHFAMRQVALRSCKTHTFCRLSFHTAVFPGTSRGKGHTFWGIRNPRSRNVFSAAFLTASKIRRKEERTQLGANTPCAPLSSRGSHLERPDSFGKASSLSLFIYF